MCVTHTSFRENESHTVTLIIKVTYRVIHNYRYMCKNWATKWATSESNPLNRALIVDLLSLLKVWMCVCCTVVYVYVMYIIHKHTHTYTHCTYKFQQVLVIGFPVYLVQTSYYQQKRDLSHYHARRGPYCKLQTDRQTLLEVSVVTNHNKCRYSTV